MLLQHWQCVHEMHHQPMIQQDVPVPSVPGNSNSHLEECDTSHTPVFPTSVKVHQQNIGAPSLLNYQQPTQRLQEVWVPWTLIRNVGVNKQQSPLPTWSCREATLSSTKENSNFRVSALSIMKTRSSASVMSKAFCRPNVLSSVDIVISRVFLQSKPGTSVVNCVG